MRDYLDNHLFYIAYLFCTSLVINAIEIANRFVFIFSYYFIKRTNYNLLILCYIFTNNIRLYILFIESCQLK